ncbi:type II secretion system minor pseudopilin GspJ [Granulosicoccaceae sp. 1_MG-2023]|nr:type II secretion system minor pseudopilin GspJ [Granulosicoccaceae sp. 1_MG-2023]
MRRSRRQSQSGFTLIELLVASAVFAIIGGAAYVGWYQIQQTRETVSQHSERLAELQRAFYWIGEDIEQLVLRPVVDEVGSTNLSLTYSEQGVSLLEFTRTGWSNPAEDVTPARSHLQRVAYFVEDGKLYRKYWYELDRFVEGEPTERRLISDLAGIRVRFLDGTEWTEQWPPANAEVEDDLLPTALEFTFDLDDMGEITRLFVVPG